MTAHGNSSQLRSFSAPSLSVCTLLGIMMIAAGVFALSDVVFATIISVKLIALVALVSGAFEIIHAFWTKGWGGFAWQILLGAIYVAFALVLLYEPALGAVVLTYLLGALLFASGIIRCALGFAHWRDDGWMMLLSGVFAVLAGLFIVFAVSAITAWLLGFLLGIDLLCHGLAWLLYAFRSVRKPA